jgi:opacity protein-like surface antigen
VKRIAIVLFAFCFGAYPAHADGIKGVAGTLGMGAISTILCTLTVVYGSDDEDASSEDFDRRGFFIGAGAAFAGENFSDRPMRDIADIFTPAKREPDDPVVIGPETTATADDSWSVNGHGGYRCHPRYSVGATLEYFGGFDTQWTGITGTGSDDIDVFVATTDIKGYLLTGRYQPYLLLGGGAMYIGTKVTNSTTGVTQSRNFTDFVFRFGGGLDFYATDHVVVNIGANYLAPLGEVSGVDLYTVGGGIEYRF